MQHQRSLALVLAMVSAGCWTQASDGSAKSSAPASSSARSSASPASSGAPASEAEATLTFKKLGKEVAVFKLSELLAKIPPETIQQFDPYYAKEKTFRGVPLVKVLELAFGDGDLSGQEYVLRAKDGYTVPMRGGLATEPGAYLAFEDVEVPGWEPIGEQKANPAPFYLVWSKKEQQNLDTHPRPYQLATIEIAKFEDVFPHTAPKGIADGEPAWRGFATFKEQCILCHAINREGGRVGPDLNVPQSVVEYRPEEQIKAYIKNPLTFRYSQMPPHPALSDRDLDDIVEYFRAMKDRKDDPDALPKSGHVPGPGTITPPPLQTKPPPARPGHEGPPDLLHERH